MSDKLDTSKFSEFDPGTWWCGILMCERIDRLKSILEHRIDEVQSRRICLSICEEIRIQGERMEAALDLQKDYYKIRDNAKALRKFSKEYLAELKDIVSSFNSELPENCSKELQERIEKLNKSAEKLDKDTHITLVRRELGL